MDSSRRASFFTLGRSSRSLTKPFRLVDAASSCTLAGLQLNLTCAQLEAINPAFSALCTILNPLEAVVCTAVETVEAVVDDLLGNILTNIPIASGILSIATHAICTATTTTTITSGTSTSLAQAVINQFCTNVITPVVTFVDGTYVAVVPCRCGRVLTLVFSAYVAAR